MRAAATRTSRALARHADVSRSGFWETTRFVRQQRTGLYVPAVPRAGGGGVVTGVGRRAPRLRRSSTSEEAPRARRARRARARARSPLPDPRGWVGPGEGPKSRKWSPGSWASPNEKPSAAAKPQTRLTQDPGFVAGASRTGTCPKCEGALQPTWISGVLPNEVRAAEGAGVGSRGDPARVRRARARTRDKEGRREREKAKKEVLTPSGARADFGIHRARHAPYRRTLRRRHHARWAFAVRNRRNRARRPRHGRRLRRRTPRRLRRRRFRRKRFRELSRPIGRVRVADAATDGPRAGRARRRAATREARAGGCGVQPLRAA